MPEVPEDLLQCREGVPEGTLEVAEDGPKGTPEGPEVIQLEWISEESAGRDAGSDRIFAHFSQTCRNLAECCPSLLGQTKQL